LLLRGRCRYCAAPISIQYPIVELTSALLFLSIYIVHGINLESILFLGLALFLLVASFIDLNVMEIPDSVTIPGTMFGLILSGFRGAAPGALLGAAFGLGFIFILARVARLIYRREAMGDGDAMLAMMIGACLGFTGVLFVTLVSFLIGGIVGIILLLSGLKRFGEEIPFGPMMALGAIIYVFFGNYLISLYLSLLWGV
jgi:leader peptidase (prepilin peptidase)/N-methyltransferase